MKKIAELLHNDKIVVYESGGMVIMNNGKYGYSTIIADNEGKPTNAIYIPINRISCGKHAAFEAIPGMKFLITEINEETRTIQYLFFTITKAEKSPIFKAMSNIEMQQEDIPAEKIPQSMKEAGLIKAMSLHCINPVYLTNTYTKETNYMEQEDLDISEYEWLQSIK